MSGIEALGIALALPGVAQQLMKTALEGYRIFQDVKEVGQDLQRHLCDLGVTEVALQDWATKLERHKSDYSIVLDPKSQRYGLVLQILAMIAGTFAEVDRLEIKYGIARNARVLPDKTRSAVESQSLQVGRPSRSRLHLPTWSFGRSRSKSTDRRSGNWKHLESAAQSTPDLSVQEKPPPSSTEVIEIDFRTLTESDLEVPMAGLDECLRQMEVKAQEYQRELSTFRKYQWAIRNQEKLNDLVNDLKKYMDYLDRLTITFLQNELILKAPTRFNEFHVETELPFTPLPNFYGRADILESIQTIMHPAISEKDQLCRRTVVVLQGMGGMGKTQIAFEYVRRNKEDYTTVFWVDVSNPSTIDASGRRIMDRLISHYAKNYPDQPKFGSIATDLQIPGQINSHGQLTGNAAKSPWPCVQKWMARDANTGWCLVVDGINDETDGDRMLELLPACAHGHIIATSRVRVADFELIEITELEKQSSVKLLLESQSKPSTYKSEEAAEEVAKMLGYLPLALSQAAAYVKKKALDLIQYLSRLSENLTRVISEKFSKYSDGIFSCWTLSVQELMKSYPHAFDLLRLCSFLSADGVSEDLLYRGLKGVEWANNEKSRLENAIDGLMTYSLIKKKAETTSKGGRIFWIHPLVQHWARESYYKERSVFLEQNSQTLAAFYRDGARSAISLVGYGVSVEHETRKSDEWIYEQENMAQINLCCNKYIPEHKLASDDVSDEKFAWALRQLGVLNYWWFKNDLAANLLEQSISLYKKLPARDPNVELEMLCAMYDLAVLQLCRPALGKSLKSSQDLIDKVESGYKILHALDLRVLKIQSLRATLLRQLGDLDGALELYQKCMEDCTKSLPQGHPVTLTTMSNFALLYKTRGEKDKALKLYDRCIKLKLLHLGMGHESTAVTYRNIAVLKTETTDYHGACEAYRASTEGFETIYGVAHDMTLQGLRGLRGVYLMLGQYMDARKVAEKIAEGKMGLKG